jgi:pyridoxal phosphate enzyme (YggS family)
MKPSTPNDNIAAPAARLAAVHARIAAAERIFGRPPGTVTLVAASKAQDAQAIRALYQAGLRHFGESYLQEALRKQDALADIDITWHFIGAVQSNKTRDLAARFAWVHGVDRLKIAERLDAQRPPAQPPLNVCIQVNVGGEPQKAGIAPAELPALAATLRTLPRLRLRGLMTLPPAAEDVQEQRRHFHALAAALRQLQAQGFALDTLSMGMSDDLEAAIAEGATLVRVGTALFGART